MWSSSRWLKAAGQTPHRSGWPAEGGEAAVDYMENEKLALALAEPPAPDGPPPPPSPALGLHGRLA